MTKSEIESSATSLLLRQHLAGSYALSFLNYRRLKTGGKAIISSISEYEKTAGSHLKERPEGLTVQFGKLSLVLYDERIISKERQNWTIAHELGHVFLAHRADGLREQREANRFAAALLMPEAVIRFLDCRAGRLLTPEELKPYFAASLTACSKRREELSDESAYCPSANDAELVQRLFDPVLLRKKFDCMD